MKKQLLLIACVSSLYVCNAQVTIDTVSVGAGYANQIWYSLPNDNQGSAAKNNWDLAFDCGGQGGAIHINSITGTTLWGYPKADTSGWATVDTSGIKTWATRWNSDTSWSEGAFNRYANASNPYDMDWGIYSMITHYVTGDSLYIIKLASGTYKKLWIVQLANGIYSFRYANLDGTSDTPAQIVKATYTGKNFAYYSIQNNTALDREPLSANWDLVFTQYTTFIPSAYTVTGILHNNGVAVAQAEPISTPTAYVNYGAHSFNTAINEIGYDWKTFTTSFVIDDSLVYFVKRSNGDIWKIIPTGFGGSSTGNFIFSKEKIFSTGITEPGTFSASMVVYPNPCTGGNTNIIYNLETPASAVLLNVYDLSGRNIFSDELNSGEGFFTYKLNTSVINTGIYIVSVTVDGRTMQQKLIIQ